MLVSEARLAANRKNAQRSTGPRTPEGKAISRQNSFKHGMTGEGVVVSGEDAAEIDRRFAVLESEFEPGSQFGRLLVRRVAMLTVRLERSVKQEAASLSVRVAGAEAALIDQRKAEAESLLHHINIEPRTGARRLRATPEGVDLLIDAWEKLRLDLDDQRGTRWDYFHAGHAEHLTGLDSGSINTSPFLGWTKALKGNEENIDPGHFAGLEVEAKRQYIFDKLSGLIEAELSGLREHRATLDTRGRDLAVAKAADIALFDPSKEAILARKYEAAAERALFRTAREIRESRVDVQAKEEVAPEPPAEPGRERAEVGSSLPANPDRPRVATEGPRSPMFDVDPAASGPDFAGPKADRLADPSGNG